MSFTECDVATNNISALDDLPNDVGGLSATQLKALFDKFGAEFVAWFNTVHLAEGNVHLAENAIDAHATIPACRVFGLVQSINSATDTPLSFNQERFDTDTIHDNSINNTRLTCKTAGKYLMFGSIVMNTGTGYIILGIRLNGTTLLAQHTMPFQSAGEAISITTVYDLAVNDYIELIVYHSNASAVSVLSSASRSPEFGMTKVG